MPNGYGGPYESEMHEEVAKLRNRLYAQAAELGAALGNLQNMVGAVDLGVPKRSRPKYLQEKLEQAQKFLKTVKL